MIRHVVTLLLLLIGNINSTAQQWASMNGGMNTSVSDFYTLDDSTLLVFGRFQHCLDGTNFNGVARWNGQNFTTLTGQPATEGWWGGASRPVWFQNKLYYRYNSIGGASFEGEDLPDGLCSYDGSELTSHLSFIPNISYIGTHNEYIVIGQVESFFGGRSFYLWDGFELDSVSINGFEEQLDILSYIGVRAIQSYQNTLYLGGNIDYLDGDIKEVFSWDNGEIGNLNGGLQGGSASVSVFEVYNDELIIGGYFFQDDGNLSSCIIRWDGENFLPMGIIGANSRVRALKSYGGYLYAGGLFTEMEGMPCRIARWDGATWECFSNSTFSFNSNPQGGGISDFEVFQDELYVCGGIHNIDGEPINHVAKYVGSLSLTLETPEHVPDTKFSVFPNPATDQIHIDAAGLNLSNVSIYNLLGKKVGDYGSSSTVNIAHLTPGMYLLNLTIDGVQMVRKFVCR
jgi:hypothetical protein